MPATRWPVCRDQLPFSGGSAGQGSVSHESAAPKSLQKAHPPRRPRVGRESSQPQRKTAGRRTSCLIDSVTPFVFAQLDGAVVPINRRGWVSRKSTSWVTSLTPFKARPEDLVAMMLKANRFASATAVCAALIIPWFEGCSSSKSDLPAGSIVEESAQNAASADTQVQHQPTILRAETASPPISGLVSDRLGPRPRWNLGWATQSRPRPQVPTSLTCCRSRPRMHLPARGSQDDPWQFGHLVATLGLTRLRCVDETPQMSLARAADRIGRPDGRGPRGAGRCDRTPYRTRRLVSPRPDCRRRCHFSALPAAGDKNFGLSRANGKERRGV